VGILFFLSFASGYEFATVVTALYFMPITFWLVLERFEFTTIVKWISKAILPIVVSFFAALGAHFLLLLIRLDSIGRSADALRLVVSKRTGFAGSSQETVFEGYSSPLSVMHTYVIMPVFGDPLGIPIVERFQIWHFILLTILAWAFQCVFSDGRGKDREFFAMGSAWLVGLIGPIGWYLLARPHSVGHTHINFILWFILTIPVGLIILGSWKPMKKRNMKNLTPVISSISIFLFCAVVILLVSYFLFSLV
jgi:hypothetical protein